jgi:hypothetical protein
MPSPLYRGTYPRRSRAVRDAAYKNPATLCWRCGRTYADAVKMYGPSGAAWQAGHIVDGHRGSPLAAEHARCNAIAGGRHGREQKRAQFASPNA